MSSVEHHSYNALAHLHHGDYHALKKLLAAHGSWSRALAASPKAGSVNTQKLWNELSKFNLQLILNTDAEFPSALREIPWIPHALYLRGAPIKNEPKIAVVGTRKAMPAGIQAAETLARDCSRAGVTIVSGLAFGIDVAAHQATLAAGGRAIAVLASGLDRITPRTNELVGEKIIERGGTLLSEYPIGTKTLPRFFIERNRIVSGLSLGIIVIEAPARSGTLATARFAVDQNREIFVVPGAMTNPNYAGSHALIRAGATLITGAADVLDALDLLPQQPGTGSHTQQLPFLDETGARIVEVLSADNQPLSVDAIAERTKLGITVINEALALLTIEGVVRENGGAYTL